MCVNELQAAYTRLNEAVMANENNAAYGPNTVTDAVPALLTYPSNAAAHLSALRALMRAAMCSSNPMTHPARRVLDTGVWDEATLNPSTDGAVHGHVIYTPDDCTFYPVTSVEPVIVECTITDALEYISGNPAPGVATRLRKARVTGRGAGTFNMNYHAMPGPTPMFDVWSMPCMSLVEFFAIRALDDPTLRLSDDENDVLDNVALAIDRRRNH